jgi:hypothetical protein
MMPFVFGNNPQSKTVCKPPNQLMHEPCRMDGWMDEKMDDM